MQTNIYTDARYIRRPDEAFFSSKAQTWTDTFWGISGQFISTYLGTVSSLSMFANYQPLFLQKLNIYLGLEFEFVNNIW